MMHTTYTLQLDEKWDLTLTDTGHIATAKETYATAQNVANECRLFTKDAYFSFDKGIPHYIIELGQRRPTPSLLRTLLRRAALSIPDVKKVIEVELEDFNVENRTLSGAIYFHTRGGGDVGINL